MTQRSNSLQNLSKKTQSPGNLHYFHYSQAGQSKVIYFLPPNTQRLFNKQTKKEKNYSRIYLISFKNVNIKMKQIQVFFKIKLHVRQTALFFKTFNFALQLANFTYIVNILHA